MGIGFASMWHCDFDATLMQLVRNSQGVTYASGIVSELGSGSLDEGTGSVCKEGAGIVPTEGRSH
jgi:hypothetical protein